MPFTLLLLVSLANLLHISAFVIYNKDLLKGKARPNCVSWFIWATITVLNFTSYGIMSDDWMKYLLPTLSSMMCIMTFVLTLFKRYYVKIKMWDVVALVIGIIATMVWWHYRSAEYANLIIQVAICVGAIPTIGSVWKNSKSETFTPWAIWSCVFVVQTIVVILRWKGQWADIVYPLNGLSWHLLIALLTFRKTSD